MAAKGAVESRLGDLFVREGLITEEQLKEGLASSVTEGHRIGYALVHLGFVQEEELTRMLARQYRVPAVDLDKVSVDEKILKLIPAAVALKHMVLPLRRVGRMLTVAMTNPTDFSAIDDLKFITKLEIEPVIVGEYTLKKHLDEYFGSTADEQIANLLEGWGEEDVEIIDGEEDDEEYSAMAAELNSAPVVKFINGLLTDAVLKGVSDIHIEPFEKELQLRYRVDGVLHNVDSPPNQLRGAIISRVKLMAKLNIAERRLPQDGRIKLKVLGKEIDLRVSTVPTMYGESVVMRILDKSNTDLVDLRRLGFPDDLYSLICQMTSKPHGIFLVTGPTGSGKTTTLYSALKRINIPDRKIITIEDPVEYQMDGINQIQVNSQIELTFSVGLRHIVRQDPDVIMIGEIRDLETAEIAIRAALTGHLVFSTLHTNDAPSAITRLIDMGVEDYLLASSLIGILAQRLVRSNCRHCRRPERLSVHTAVELGFSPQGTEEYVEIQKGPGCDQCGHTGYESRLGIFEMVDVDDDLRQVITSNPDANALMAQALRSGMRPLKSDGWSKVLAGITTPDEILRVTQEV